MPLSSGSDSHPRHLSVVPGGDAAAPARTPEVDVLVVGAGPTGLTAAAEARRHGLSVRIIERRPHRSEFSKALVVHARTLEVFQAMGIADGLVAQGARFAALNAHPGSHGRPVRIDLLALPWGDAAYPYWLSVPQYATEQTLERHLVSLGVQIEWRTALRGAEDRGRYAEALIEHADGTEETLRARWIVGCDGARSLVREQAGLDLGRSDAGATFILADVKTTAGLKEDEGHVFLAPEGLLLIVPMPEPSRWRVIAHVPDPPRAAPITIDADYLDELIRRRAGLEFHSHDVVWQSQFDLSHGVADHYRNGRLFIAGDAAHVHSPVGGQGLNTGVQDAHNLAWKLAAARRMDPQSADRLLDSYEAERRPIAQAMVQGTARATGALTARNGLLRHLLGAIAPHLLARPQVQARLGRGVGMLDLGYPRGPLTRTATSRAAGLRLPNPRLSTGGRLHQRLNRTGYTWIVRARAGQSAPDATALPWADTPVVFLRDETLAEPLAGLERVTLVRPDGYIAATAPTIEAVRAQLPPAATP